MTETPFFNAEGDAGVEADPDDLVTLVMVETAFEGHTIVGVLKSAGIDAVAFDTANAAFGIPLRPGGRGVPVQVRREDLLPARAALDENRADTDDDDQEIGVDPPHVPIAARFATLVVLAMVVLMLIALLVMAVL